MAPLAQHPLHQLSKLGRSFKEAIVVSGRPEAQVVHPVVAVLQLDHDVAKVLHESPILLLIASDAQPRLQVVALNGFHPVGPLIAAAVRNLRTVLQRQYLLFEEIKKVLHIPLTVARLTEVDHKPFGGRRIEEIQRLVDIIRSDAVDGILFVEPVEEAAQHQRFLPELVVFPFFRTALNHLMDKRLGRRAFLRLLEQVLEI